MYLRTTTTSTTYVGAFFQSLVKRSYIQVCTEKTVLVVFLLFTYFEPYCISPVIQFFKKSEQLITCHLIIAMRLGTLYPYQL